MARFRGDFRGFYVMRRENGGRCLQAAHRYGGTSLQAVIRAELRSTFEMLTVQDLRRSCRYCEPMWRRHCPGRVFERNGLETHRIRPRCRHLACFSNKSHTFRRIRDIAQNARPTGKTFDRGRVLRPVTSTRSRCALTHPTRKLHPEPALHPQR